MSLIQLIFSKISVRYFSFRAWRHRLILRTIWSIYLTLYCSIPNSLGFLFITLSNSITFCCNSCSCFFTFSFSASIAALLLALLAASCSFFSANLKFVSSQPSIDFPIQLHFVVILAVVSLQSLPHYSQ